MIFPLVVLLSAASPAAPEGRVVEEVVAVVRNPPGAAPRVVTLTRLDAEARVALVARGAVAAAFRPLDREALRAGLAWLLDETVVADEAARLKLHDPEPAALAAQLRTFRAAFRDAGEYARFLEETALAEEDVQAVLARSLRARRFVESRVGRAAVVAEDEVDAYLAARGLSARTAEAREAVRGRIADDRAAAQARALVAELRARADIRVVDPALRPAAAAGAAGAHPPVAAEGR
ncbi:hypothetical protein [Anaeromyxobacter oryzae]|nr:hypothetical protein [Anaeromyxobacter oryzae]